MIAKHKASGNVVAVKVIDKNIVNSQVYSELLHDELAVLERIDHPHITKVFELIEDKKYFFVVMEYIAGGNLLDKVLSVSKFTES